MGSSAETAISTVDDQSELAERIPFSPDRPLSREERNRIASEGMTELAWKINEFSMPNGQTIRLIGLAHHKGTFYSHRSDIEQIVKNSSVVVLEGYLDIDVKPSLPESLPHPDEIAALRQKIKKLVDSGIDIPVKFESITDEMLKHELVLYGETVSQFEFYQLYDRIKQLAAYYGKELALVDPMESLMRRAREKIAAGIEDGLNQDLEDGFEFSSAERSIREGIALGGSTALIAGIIASIVAKKTAVSRRVFFSIAGLGGIAAGIGGTSMIANKSEEAAYAGDAPFGRVINPLGLFRYNGDDYREVVIARGLSYLANMRASEPVSVFIGFGHVDSLEYYATHPLEARLRLLAYPQQYKFRSPVLAIYGFNEQNGEWRIKRLETLLTA